MTKMLKGRCLCGAVAYEAAGEPMMTGHCHCVDCRKTSGTGHGTHVAMRAEAARIKGALASYAHPADSGNIVTRYFCPACGAPIHSTNSAMPGMVFLRASSLDDPDQITPQMIVYRSRAPKWDVMDEGLPSFAEMPEGGPPPR
ncbi:MAG: GFA family protein [Pseudomonadota bacterium]